jgi:hypothetical protein
MLIKFDFFDLECAKKGIAHFIFMGVFLSKILIINFL